MDGVLFPVVDVLEELGRGCELEPSLDYSAPSQSVGLEGRPSAARRCCPALLLAPFLPDGSEISALR